MIGKAESSPVTSVFAESAEPVSEVVAVSVLPHPTRAVLNTETAAISDNNFFLIIKNPPVVN